MFKSYKYRIYPTFEHREMIDKTMEVCRFVYNLALETKIYAYKSAKINLTVYDLQKQLTELKEEYTWISEVDSQAVQHTIKILGKSFSNFFNGRGYPKFKSKHNRGAFTCPNNKREVNWEKQTLTIPKIHNIPIKITSRIIGEIKSVTISKTFTGKYFASITAENKCPPAYKLIINKALGIDVGIKSFAITSDGRSFEANRKLKENLQRLKVLQRRSSLKKKGGKNRKKANLKVALLHEKISNQRTDYIHKITHELTHDSQVDTLVVEDLNVKGMIKNRCLSQALSDVSFGEFFRQLQYKCEWYGKNLIKIGRFEPSSKMCSECGKINDGLTLADREWDCSCGTHHDRDLNAAKNIKRIGLEKYSGVGSAGEPVESRRLRRAKKQEFVPKVL